MTASARRSSSRVCWRSTPPCTAARSRSRRRTSTWAPAAGTRPARPSRTPTSRRSARTTRSCWAPSVTRACRRACSSAGCCSSCASRWTTTSTCARAASTRASRRRWRDPGEIDFVVVREGTEGPYVGNGGAIRVGTPHEVANEVSVNTAFGVERVVRDAFARAAARPRKKLTLVHKHNVLVHAGHLWRRTVEAVERRVPRRDGRLPARGRGDHLPGHQPGAVRRHRHRQPVRRHPHGPGRGHHRRHRARGVGQHQPGPDGAAACSSRCTARRRTSRARARPTRPPRCCPSRCCSSTSASPEAAARVEKAVADDIVERGGRASTVDGRGGQGPRRAHRRLIRILAGAAAPRPDATRPSSPVPSNLTLVKGPRT